METLFQVAAFVIGVFTLVEAFGIYAYNYEPSKLANTLNYVSLGVCFIAISTGVLF